MRVEVDPVPGIKIIVVIGLLASLVGGVVQSVLWFGVGAGLLLGVALQIAAAIVAAYLVVTTIPEFHPARHDHAAPGGATGDARRGPWAQHASGLASA